MNRNQATAIGSACAISGAVALWLNIDAHPPVVAAARGAGLLELIASLAATFQPAASLASILTVWHRVAVVVAAMLVALTAWRLTRSVVSSIAIGLVAAASPIMAPVLAPPDVMAIVAAAATALALVSGSTIGALAALVIAGAIAPALILPNAILSWWVASRGPARASHLRGFAFAAGSVVIAVGLISAVPALPGSAATTETLRALTPTGPVSAGLDALVTSVSSFSALALALAAFGVFALFSPSPSGRESSDRQSGRALVALGVTGAVAVAALGPDVDLQRTLAPLIVSVWLLAAVGVSEIRVRSGTRWREAGGILVAVILAAVHLDPRINQRPNASDKIVLMGHELLTQRNFHELIYKLPPDSALVTDDAVADTLLRSISGSLRRSRNGITVVPRTVAAVAAARGSHRVFAMPRAQAELQLRGVRLTDRLAVPGLAEVDAVVACDPLSTAWRTAASATGITSLAMVADTDQARGPIVVYAGGAAAITPTAVAWPPIALRGFHTSSYDRASADGKQVLSADIAYDGAPADHASVNSAYVSRIEMWRVPGAPRALTFALSAPASSVMAMQLARAAGPMQLCPVFPFSVSAFRQ